MTPIQPSVIPVLRITAPTAHFALSGRCFLRGSIRTPGCEYFVTCLIDTLCSPLSQTTGNSDPLLPIISPEAAHVLLTHALHLLTLTFNFLTCGSIQKPSNKFNLWRKEWQSGREWQRGAQQKAHPYHVRVPMRDMHVSGSGEKSFESQRFREIRREDQ